MKRDSIVNNVEKSADSDLDRMKVNSEFGKIIRFYIPSIISFFLGLLSAVILTRIFDKESYGLLNIFNNSAALILSISYLGFDSAYIRFYNDTPKGIDSKQLGFGLMRLSLLIYLICSFAILFFGRKNFSKYIFGFESTIIVIFLLLNVFAQIIIRYFLINYRMTFNTKMYSFFTVAQQFSTRLFVICSAIFTSNIIIVLGTNAMGIVIVVLGLFIFKKEDLIPYKAVRLKDMLQQRAILRFAFFAAPAPLIVSLNSFIAQRVIVSGLGNSTVGIYSSAGFFTTVLSVLQSGFATYWAAYMYKSYKTRQVTISKVHDCLMLIVIVVYAMFILFRDLLYLVIGSEFHESKQFFTMVIFYPMMLLLCESTGYGISLAKKNYLTVIIQAFTMTINCGLAYALIGEYGLKGVAFASAISGALYFILTTLFGQRFYRTIRSWSTSIIGFIVLVFLMLLSGIATDNIISIGTLIILSVAIIVYRKSLLMMWNVSIGYLKVIMRDN